MKKFILLLILAINLVSCSEQDLNDYIADNILYNLSISTQSVSASPIDEEHTVKIDTNTEWSAQTSDDWIILENYNGSSNGELRFETKANPLTEIREGKIGIYCFGKHKKDIMVKQSNVSLSLNEEYLEFGSNESFREISFETMGTWNANSNNEWIHLATQEGFGSAKIKISIDELLSCKDRNGSVTITDQSDQSKEITIKQNGKFIKINQNYLSFLSSGEDIEKIEVETDGKISWSSENDWINNIIEESNILKIKVSENTTKQIRKGIITLNLEGILDSENVEIQVYQPYNQNVGETVDLGLSVKWSSFNLGALDENEIGNYFKYGEGLDYTYDWDRGIPYTDPLTGTSYDTANSYWGGRWRIPSLEEWKELVENCSIEEIDFINPQTIDVYNYHTGYHYNIEVTKAYKFSRNGNFIILPIAGAWFHNDSVGAFSYDRYPSEILQSCAYHTDQLYNYSNVVIITPTGVSHHSGHSVVWSHFAPVRPVWED